MVVVSDLWFELFFGLLLFLICGLNCFQSEFVFWVVVVVVFCVVV